jgi:hypothetical protein
MVQKVFKYDIPVNDEWIELELPDGAEIVHVASQYGTVNEIQMWVLLDPDLAQTPRYFRVFGTGHEIPPEAKFRGTCIVAEGHLVWHLMEA